VTQHVIRRRNAAARAGAAPTEKAVSVSQDLVAKTAAYVTSIIMEQPAPLPAIPSQIVRIVTASVQMKESAFVMQDGRGLNVILAPRVMVDKIARCLASLARIAASAVCAQQMPRARASMSLHRPTAPFARKGTTVNRARLFAWPTSRVERRAGVDGMDNAYAKKVTEGQDVHRAAMGIKEKDVQRRAIGKQRATRTGEFSKRANASVFLDGMESRAKFAFLDSLVLCVSTSVMSKRCATTLASAPIISSIPVYVTVIQVGYLVMHAACTRQVRSAKMIARGMKHAMRAGAA